MTCVMLSCDYGQHPRVTTCAAALLSLDNKHSFIHSLNPNNSQIPSNISNKKSKEKLDQALLDGIDGVLVVGDGRVALHGKSVTVDAHKRAPPGKGSLAPFSGGKDACPSQCPEWRLLSGCKNCGKRVIWDLASVRLTPRLLHSRQSRRSATVAPSARAMGATAARTIQSYSTAVVGLGTTRI